MIIDIVDESITVVPTVSKHIAPLDIYMFQYRDRIIDIITLPFTEHDIKRIAICIYGSMDLGARSAAAVSDLVRRPIFPGTGTVLMGLDNGGIQ